MRRPHAPFALALLVVACGDSLPPPPPAPAVTVAEVIAREVREWDEFTGRLEAVDAVQVRPRVTGYVQRVRFAEGREVRPGEVLFEIDARPYEAELARAEAELVRARTRAELAAREVERAEKLLARQAISREEYDTRASGRAEADAEIRAAEAAVATARLNVEWTRVRSPIAGRVSRAEVTEGNLVQAGPPEATLLTTVVSVDPVYVYFEGDEQTYLRYQDLARAGTRRSSREVRNPVRMALANETGYPHEGVVDFVDNQLDPQSGTIRARAVFRNPDRSLTPGLFARLQLVGSGSYRATLVRDAAVGTDQDRKFVYVLKPDSTVEYRPVVPGRLVDGLRVIRSGLEAGERVVVAGLPRIRPGAKVAAATAPMDTTLAAQPAAGPQATPGAP